MKTHLILIILFLGLVGTACKQAVKDNSTDQVISKP